jgi:hypothetical protein
MAFLFEAERRIRCSVQLERDLAATVQDGRRRAKHLDRASRLSDRLPGSRAEGFLLLDW